MTRRVLLILSLAALALLASLRWPIGVQYMSPTFAGSISLQGWPRVYGEAGNWGGNDGDYGVRVLWPEDLAR